MLSDSEEEDVLDQEWSERRITFLVDPLFEHYLHWGRPSSTPECPDAVGSHTHSSPTTMSCHKGLLLVNLVGNILRLESNTCHAGFFLRTKLIQLTSEFSEHSTFNGEVAPTKKVWVSFLHKLLDAEEVAEESARKRHRQAWSRRMRGGERLRSLVDEFGPGILLISETQLGLSR